MIACNSRYAFDYEMLGKAELGNSAFSTIHFSAVAHHENIGHTKPTIGQRFHMFS